jgi:hypothetical protein
VLPRGLWSEGFGFRRTGLWARPRPGALGGALVMPRKIWPGPVFDLQVPPPKFPGVAMGSCLPRAGNRAFLLLERTWHVMDWWASNGLLFICGAFKKWKPRPKPQTTKHKT